MQDGVLFLCTSETVGCKTALGTTSSKHSLVWCAPAPFSVPILQTNPPPFGRKSGGSKFKTFVQEQAGLWPWTFSGLLCFIFPDTKTKVSGRKQLGVLWSQVDKSHLPRVSALSWFLLNDIYKIHSQSSALFKTLLDPRHQATRFGLMWGSLTGVPVAWSLAVFVFAVYLSVVCLSLSLCVWDPFTVMIAIVSVAFGEIESVYKPVDIFVRVSSYSTSPHIFCTSGQRWPSELIKCFW